MIHFGKMLKLSCFRVFSQTLNAIYIGTVRLKSVIERENQDKQQNQQSYTAK